MYKTEQEKFWSGNFGDEYIERNADAKLLSSNLHLFSDILSKTDSKIASVIEFGANIGLNLKAIEQLLPNAELNAIEINKKAAAKLQESIAKCKVYQNSILEADYLGENEYKYDFVFIKGVLIHINPNELNNVYDKLYKTAKKYICIAEYYNPTPVEVNYRGYKNKLFKRDFAGEILDRYKDLKLADYKFCYSRDNCFPMDDITWFLLEKC